MHFIVLRVERCSPLSETQVGGTFPLAFRFLPRPPRQRGGVGNRGPNQKAASGLSDARWRRGAAQSSGPSPLTSPTTPASTRMWHPHCWKHPSHKCCNNALTTFLFFFQIHPESHGKNKEEASFFFEVVQLKTKTKHVEMSSSHSESMFFFPLCFSFKHFFVCLHPFRLTACQSRFKRVSI